MDQPFPDPRTLLRTYGLSAKKSWGQNFLIAERAYRAIVDATVRAADDWIVELGAGLGTLTMRLAERVPEGKILAVERDRDLAAVLGRELGHLDNVEVVEANALTYDLGMVARWRGEPIAVCGNLPYHIASQILFRVIEARQHVTHAVVMLQREMADRLVARPGTKSYGALGVLLGTYADISTVIQVDRGGFAPPPKVDSTVVRLTMLPGGQPRVPVVDDARYADVVHAAFGQRRKTLRNALRARHDLATVDRALEREGIAPGRRGETLTIDEFARLAAALGQ
jgi:16S rRNA (adenine1518-N6/adenine1519-N6)-dimethyltransferase